MPATGGILSRINRRLTWGLIILSLCAVGRAEAAELKITDVKAYVFLERAGKLSDDILGGPLIVNAPQGGAPGGDTATVVLLDLIFEGDKNASPKYAHRDG